MQIGIVGSGAIGTDLRAEMAQRADLELSEIAGSDPGNGLAELLRLGAEIGFVLGAIGGTAHRTHSRLLLENGISSVDLTLVAVGRAIVPDPNVREHLDRAAA